MADSARTTNLKNKIAAVDAKLTALEDAKKTLSGVDTEFKTSMDGIDDLHVKGDKYDSMRTAEEDAAEAIKNTLNSTKNRMLAQISSAILTLKLTALSLTSQLAVSMTADTAAATAKAAAAAAKSKNNK